MHFVSFKMHYVHVDGMPPSMRWQQSRHQSRSQWHQILINRVAMWLHHMSLVMIPSSWTIYNVAMRLVS